MLDREDYEAFRSSVRRLAEDKIAPHAASYDEESRFPEETLEAFKELDIVGLPLRESHGGNAADVLVQAICLEEVARVCATSSLTLMVIWSGLNPINIWGGDKLADEVIAPAVRGDVVVSICLTEAHGGSDMWGAKTTARRDGDEWIINGKKSWISNATRSDWYTVLCRTGETTFGVFVVHKDDPGLSFGRLEKKMGMRGSPTADVNFENCRIPGHRAVGDPEKGYDYITSSLTRARPMIAAQALGIAQGALEGAVSYTNEREIFGKPVSSYQMTKGTIAELATKIEAARQLLYRACEAVENGEGNARMLASMAKLTCSNVAMETTVEAVQLHGGAGYVRDYPAERMMRDAKITQIYEGTSEIQKLIIAKSILAN
ncbi:acyl-CoA dehydrogenase family protein [Limimaricola cinnabarinus]|uniref:3-sulfinopropanoyl-CoA desulfinase n=1 Tax=Limimaricola cinnabarinus LL-001 TaxID=1337093 RepID=U2Z696_9RHOB|nr:acyl-CoA dehydrogenase family protein [Limimaricola cinnabarinus]GAD56930.1 butyryl-CoA dehydrogenase [Limimaricola cinnabarinus LL-001]